MTQSKPTKPLMNLDEVGIRRHRGQRPVHLAARRHRLAHRRPPARLQPHRAAAGQVGNATFHSHRAEEDVPRPRRRG
ncbi:MAG: hypothetical protein U1F25_03270 [Rubrivivax sp.]